MSENAIVIIIAALIAGIPPSLVAWNTLRESRKTTTIAKMAVQQTVATTKKVDVVIAKAEELHVLTNGNLSKVTAALDISNQKNAVFEEKILGLEKMLAQMVEAMVAVKREVSEANGKDK